jgi:protein required for attachment to host cells
MEKSMSGQRIWILAADGARARIVVDPGSVIGDEFVFIAERRKIREAIDSPAGRSFASVGRRRSRIEARSDPVREDEHEFACMLAGVLEEKRRQGLFDRLVIVAAARMLGELRQALSRELRTMVEAEIAKDLTRLPVADIRGAVESYRNADS